MDLETGPGLVQALQQLHADAGRPSTRALAERIGSVSHTTVADTLSGRRLPSASVLAGIVRALGGDEDYFQRLLAEADEHPFSPSNQEQLARYKAQLTRYYGMLRGQQLGDRGPVALSELYVAPHLAAWPVPPTTPLLDPVSANSGDRTLTFGDRVVILGEPGSGKSTLCAAMALSLARDRAGLIPFLIRVRDLVDPTAARVSVVQFIERLVATMYQSPFPDGLVSEVMMTGRAVVIFDGLDEVANQSVRLGVPSIIEMFALSFPKTRIVVTSRLAGYVPAEFVAAGFEHLTILPLTEAQVAELSERWFSASGLPRPDIERLASNFWHATSPISDLRSNPLMLTLALSLYRSNNYIPRDRLELYDQTVRMGLQGWDMQRGIEIPRYVVSDGMTLLGILAYKIWESHTESQEIDLTEAVAILAQAIIERHPIEDVLDARRGASSFVDYCTSRSIVLSRASESKMVFAHRSFFEYFVAREVLRQGGSPGNAASILLDSVGTTDWESVALLTAQLCGQHFEGGRARAFQTLFEAAAFLDEDMARRVRVFVKRENV